jgi:hypothetical protein
MKRIVGLALVAALAALTLSSIPLPASAFGHTTVTNPPWKDNNYFSMCNHDSQDYGSYWDFWVAIGVSAYYDPTEPTTPYNDTVGFLHAE